MSLNQITFDRFAQSASLLNQVQEEEKAEANDPRHLHSKQFSSNLKTVSRYVERILCKVKIIADDRGERLACSVQRNQLLPSKDTQQMRERGYYVLRHLKASLKTLL